MEETVTSSCTSTNTTTDGVTSSTYGEMLHAHTHTQADMHAHAHAHTHKLTVLMLMFVVQFKVPVEMTVWGLSHEF